MKGAIAAAVLSAAFLHLHAQEKVAAKDAATPPDRPLTLEMTKTTKTQMQGRPFAKIGCDDDGSIYARPYILQKAMDGTAFQSPIQKIKPDAAPGESFKVTDADSDMSAADFFITKNGEVYVAAWTSQGDSFLVSFSSDGSFKSKTKIEQSGITIYQLAVFKSGEILLSGTEGEGDHTPFTAVFTQSGKLIKKLDSPEDQAFKRSAATGDSNFAAQSTGGYGNSSVALGEAVAGSDGNIYLMRSSSPAVVFAVSPAGEIIRTIKIDVEDPSMFPTNLKSAPGKLAVVFHKNRGSTSVDGVVRIVDYEGNPISSYLLKESWSGGALACYIPPSFVFINTKSDGFAYLFNAEPK